MTQQKTTVQLSAAFIIAEIEATRLKTKDVKTALFGVGLSDLTRIVEGTKVVKGPQASEIESFATQKGWATPEA